MFKYNNKFGSALTGNLLSVGKSMFAILNKCNQIIELWVISKEYKYFRNFLSDVLN